MNIFYVAWMATNVLTPFIFLANSESALEVVIISTPKLMFPFLYCLFLNEPSSGSERNEISVEHFPTLNNYKLFWGKRQREKAREGT